MTEVKVEDVAVEEAVEGGNEGPEKTVRVDVEDGKLSVHSGQSVVETLYMLNAAMSYVLERAMVNQHVGEEGEQEEGNHGEE